MAQSMERPNVILIMTDDQGYGDLACHGNPYLKTPYLDQLYRQSVRLTNYHTGTTCSPTRAALLTGQPSNRVGVWHTVVGRSLLRPGDSVPTMAELFAQNGYQTAIFGKWHLGDNYPLRPQDRGFMESVVHGGGGVGQTPDYWNNDYFDDTYLHNGKPQRYAGYCTDVWFSEATRYIEHHAKEMGVSRKTPFFCYIAPNAPHSPYHVPDSYALPYRNDPAIPNPNFYGMITALDEQIGRLMKRLDELNLTQNTVLIFTTDNGTAAGAAFDKSGGPASRQVMRGFNAGMRGLKGSVYEGGHRVPFFIRFPNGNLIGGRDVPQLTTCTDVLPTLLRLCNLTPPPNAAFEGADLSKLLRQDAAPWPRRTLVVDTQREDSLQKNRPSAVMTDRWRLINGRELYDLPNDPAQTRDLAATYPDTVRLLQQAYERWWTDVSRRSNERVRIEIGASMQPRSTILNCMDVHPVRVGQSLPAWDQTQVRKAVASDGYWALRVRSAGRYRVSLRRWPPESGLSNGDAAPAGELVPGGQAYAPGQKLVFQKASVRVNAQTHSQPLASPDADASFILTLPEGPLNLQAWFTSRAGVETGVFYVVVEKM